MKLNEIDQIKVGVFVYDILKRKYRIENYSIKYYEGAVVQIFLDIRNEFGDLSQNIEYQFLYTNTEHMSDLESLFCGWVKDNYMTSTQDLYYLTLDELYKIFTYFSAGFNSYKRIVINNDN
jgi:hypothetical protein